MVSGGGVVGIWMVSIVVCGARMCLVGYLIAYPLQGGEFTLFCHSPKRQEFFHLAIMIKISKCPYISLTKIVGFGHFRIF